MTTSLDTEVLASTIEHALATHLQHSSLGCLEALGGAASKPIAIAYMYRTEGSVPIRAGRSPGRNAMNQEDSIMQHHRYPTDWRSRAQACLERASYRCEGCGI